VNDRLQALKLMPSSDCKKLPRHPEALAAQREPRTIGRRRDAKTALASILRDARKSALLRMTVRLANKRGERADALYFWTRA
jgi:hypothetical protein